MKAQNTDNNDDVKMKGLNLISLDIDPKNFNRNQKA